VTRDVTVGVLGPLDVRRGTEPVHIEGLKRRQVMAVLAAARGDTVSGTRICEALWGEHLPETAPTTLQSHVSRLRQAVRPLPIVSAADGYALDLDGVEFDVDRFEALVAEARAHTGRERALLLQEALGLWRGPAFGELADLAWVRGEALRLEELRLVVTEDCLDARLDSGEDAELVGELEALLTEHPLREKFWRQLILALYRTGRQGEALRRCDALRGMLRNELGLDPSPAAQELEQRILGDDATLLLDEAEERPAAPPSSRPDSEATSLIGRATDIAQVLDALESRTVVTISGPGGVGKTRIALRAASMSEDRFRDGVVVVELAPLRDPARTVQVIARALDVQQRQHRSLDDTVQDFLADKELLLVLDNCEHVVGTVAPLVDRLRHRGADVTVLATSRAPLGLPGEHVHVLPPLAAPPLGADLDEVVGAPAVQLFVERATAASPGFVLDQQNAAAVSEICRRLDGLPLAIELAAARTRALGPTALASRLDQRFSLLAGERRGADDRHHTLQRVVEWSYELLEPREQEAFSQLSVFAGTFGLQAAERICRLAESEPSGAVGALVNLVDKSMVRLVAPDEPRYVVLETLRQFGQERLAAMGMLAEVEARHRSWYLDFAEEAALGIDSADEGTWSELVDRELDNFRAAHASAVQAADLDVAARLVVALREYAFRRIQYEVTGWAETTLRMNGADEHPLAALVAAVAAYGRWVRGDLEAAIELGTRAVQAQERSDLTPRGLAERVLGNAYFYRRSTDEALAWMDRMLEIARAGDSPSLLVHALYMSSVARASIGEPDIGLARAQEAADAALLADSPTARAQAAYALGLALRSTDTEESQRQLRLAAELGTVGGNRWIRAFALTEVHWLTARTGDLLGGLAGYAEVIDAWYRGGDWANQWLSLRHVFGILIRLQAHTAAAVLHGALVAAGAAYALPFEPDDADRLAQEVDHLRDLLGPADFSIAVRHGAAMTESEIVSYVQSQIVGLIGQQASPT
jgi:predicted ATPase/DNA-binding SARP family transcriptional activator